MPFTSSHPSASRVRQRALLGTAMLVVLVALAGLAVYVTRDGRTPSKPSAAPASSGALTSAVPETTPPPHGVNATLPVPPDTHDPIAFGKAAAVALWSYDTRTSSQPELLDALHHWLTSETKYADRASVDALVPSPVLWTRMADNAQYATATANEAHFPASFTQALQADPGAITTAYVYAVTVTGSQSIAWRGSPRGGAEARAITLAVQCRPDRPCALAGVLPNVAP
ncbi:hypothetical protein [Actinacidiphila acididurans]|uniref:Secreted protein n=1 Tax=Actinacidiphila acididurans TaxID=2784346 RepID=A0ABS2TYU5_9ACTN|nr:hypothetical protein [Actinacidiphila acididurans]MBM9507997.1 hypothetical protein [Actinacidiphila acididurans]